MKKFLSYIFIVIILFGLFSPTIVNAQTPEKGICTAVSLQDHETTLEECKAEKGIKWKSLTTGNVTFIASEAQSAEEKAKAEESAKTKGSNSFESQIQGSCSILSESPFSGCIILALYMIFFYIPSGLLYMAAYLFNIMLAITLSSTLFKDNAFIAEAWRIVRDFSNIFFILILLYVSAKMILGLGGSGVKKIISQVVIVALLINFSMFFTQVIIDSSNILALIFYNKIDVKTSKDGVAYKPATNSTSGVQEKDFARAIAESFNPTRLINADDFKPKAVQSGTPCNDGKNTLISIKGDLQCQGPAPTGTNTNNASAATSKGEIPPSIKVLLIFVSGAIFLFAAYAFFIAGISFLGRLVELWMCIIFSPFAFMSLSIPQLEGLTYLGWKAWLDRLLSVAFMAPIFMFFMLLLSKIIQVNPVSDLLNKASSGGDIVGSLIDVANFLLLIFIPAFINLTLLHKATEYAKKGGGELSGMLIKGGTLAAGLVGGLALGAATGGASLAGTAVLGRAGAAIAGSKTLADRELKGGIGGFLSGKLRDVGKYGAAASYDPRNVKAFSKATAAAGIDLGKGREGGWKGVKEKQAKKHEERAAELEKISTKDEKKDLEEAKAKKTHAETELKTGEESVQLDKAKETLKLAELPIKADLENFDNTIKALEAKLSNAAKAGDTDLAAMIKISIDEQRDLKKEKEDAAGGGVGLTALKADVRTKQTAYNAEEARILSGAEKEVIDAQRKFNKASGEVLSGFAEQIAGKTNKIWGRVLNLGLYSGSQANETSRKIRQHAETKEGKH